MHIETLKIFRDLVETQSFSLTAERNDMTQSAVSQQITTLEARYKDRLLVRERGRREVSLTYVGELFYQRCCSVVDSYELLNKDMRFLERNVSTT